MSCHLPNRSLGPAFTRRGLLRGGLGALTLPIVGLPTTAVAQTIGPVYNPATDAYYEVVHGTITWEDAKAAAAARTFQGRSGSLATITSQAEMDFIAAHLGGPGALSIHWLGGMRADGAINPRDGWYWPTGEPWTYENWAPGEPNNWNGIENRLLWSYSNQWNDGTGTFGAWGYVVEYPALRSHHLIHEDSIAFQASGLIDPNSDTYLYAPCVMYDVDEPVYKFKLWACKGVAGDYILYKESPTYEGLKDAQWQEDALTPSGQGNFDNNHVCDPSVIKYGPYFYLYYTGANEQTNPPLTGIGVAISSDGGRTFNRLPNGVIVTGPQPKNKYGLGQPAVAYAPDGYFYMVYTDDQDSLSEVKLQVIRSLSPSFPLALREHVATFQGHEIGGVSLDMGYNTGRGEFIMTVNASDASQPRLTHVRLIHLDKNFHILGSTSYAYAAGFQFGEGIGLLRNGKGEVSRFYDPGPNRWHINVVAATFGHHPGFPDHVTGPMKYARFTEGPSGVLTDFALPGDIALQGDLDGDSQDDLIILRPSTYQWFYKLSSESFRYVHSTQWGLPQDVPFVADFNGDGQDEMAVWRPSNGTWYILYSGSWGNGNYDIVQWGLNGDIPVPADYSGSGKCQAAVWRPSNGTWYILYSGSWGQGKYDIIQWGLNGDQPIAHDFDSDGKADLGVWRPSEGKLYIRYANGSTQVIP